MKRPILMLLLLAGCGEPALTKEGCPAYYGEFTSQITAGCVQAYYEERAKASGGTVTRCFPSPGGVTCVSE